MRTIHLVYFPRSIFPVSGVGANIVVTLMSCMIILPIIYIYDMPITAHMIWIPVGVLMAGFMALGLGMMMAPLNCVNGDVEHLIRFITRAGFFVSPVMWTAEMALERGAWGEAALWNPMVVPITKIRTSRIVIFLPAEQPVVELGPPRMPPRVSQHLEIWKRHER